MKTDMFVTTEKDGIFVSGHGVLSIRRMANGVEHLDPFKLGSSLAKVNRYAGNSIVPWNDAEHSLLVANLTQHYVFEHWDIKSEFPPAHLMDTVPYMHRLYDRIREMQDYAHNFAKLCYHWGLLHDVVEVVVGDTPNPVKHYEESSARASSAEEDIIAQLKDQQMGAYVERFLTDIGHYSPKYRETHMLHVYKLLQCVVKPADKLALLVEMANLHEPPTFDYVCRNWDIPDRTRRWAATYQWPRLNTQVGYDNIRWDVSAKYWTRVLNRSKAVLDATFKVK